MGRLIYFSTLSLDGYIADREGDFAWGAPDAEVHAFTNDCLRSAGIHLYGRRTYELMTVWETDPSLAEESEPMRDFAAMWQRADKIVYSSSLETVTTGRTSLERTFDPDAVRRLKDTAEADLLVCGAHLAAQAIRAGLVDEYRFYLCPIVLGGGTAYLPEDVRLELELLDERRFPDGRVYLRYAARR